MFNCSVVSLPKAFIKSLLLIPIDVTFTPHNLIQRELEEIEIPKILNNLH